MFHTAKRFSRSVLTCVRQLVLVWLCISAAQTAWAASANLVMAKSGPTNALAGDIVTYQLVVSNNGPDAAHGATVRDALPSGMTAVSATCTQATGAAVCPAPGSISIAGNVFTTTIATFPVNGQVTFNLQAAIALASNSSYSNTATVTVPAGVTETNPNTNASTVGTSVSRLSMDLASSLTGGSTSFVEGTPLTYTATFSNLSGNALPQGAGSYSLSASATLASLNDRTYTCVGAIGTTCPASLSGGSLPAMPAGSSFTISFTFTPSSNPARCAANPAANTSVTIQAGISVTSGVTDTNTGNNQVNAFSSGKVNNAQCPVVSGSKTGPASLDFSGATQAYTIVLTNQGPGPADGWKISDNVATAGNYTAYGLYLNPQTYTCTTSWGDPCPNFPVQNQQLTNGTFGLVRSTAVPQWPEGGVITLTIPIRPSILSPLPCGPVDPSLQITNSVYGMGNSFAGSTTTLLGRTMASNASIGVPQCPQADLQLTRTGPTAIAMGEPMPPYALTITNLGPGDADGATLDDTLSSPNFVSRFSQASITCQATGGAQCPAIPAPSDTPGIRVTLPPIPKLPSGGSITLSYSGGIPQLVGNACPAASMHSAFSGSVSVPTGTTDPNSANNRASSSLVYIDCAVLSVNKQSSSNSPQLNDPLTYTITVSNASPGANAAGRVISDALPAGFTYAGNASCSVASGAAVCGPITYDAATHTISATIGSLPANASLQLSIPGQVTQPGSWVNTASVPVNGGTFGSPLPASGSSTISMQTRGIDLGLQKQGPALYTAGQALSYTLIASNYGDAINDATVIDSVPAALSDVTWSCLGVNGASCGTASGSGNDILVLGDFPQGGSTSGKLVITVQGTVNGASVAPITNTARVDPPAGLTDLVPGNNQASVTSTLLVPPAADLTISKTASKAFYTQGMATPLSYTVTIANKGPDPVSAATLSEAAVAHLSLLSWTCTAGAGAQCAAASGAGSPDGAQFDLAPQSQVSFTIAALIDAGATAAVVNTASVSAATPPDPDAMNNSAQATVRPGLAPGMVNLSLSKNVTPSVYNVGQTTAVTYTLYVQNIGNTEVNNAIVQDELPAGLSFSHWSCVATQGSCSASGLPDANGNLHDLVSLAPNGTATYTVMATVASSVNGELVNTASVTPPEGIIDIDPSGNQSSVTISPQGVPQADLQISQTVTPGNYTPYTSTSIIYTIEASNNGPVNVADALISSLADAGIIVDSWSCVPGSGASCPPSGSGALPDLSVNLAAGASLRLTINAHIGAQALGNKGQTVRIATPAGTIDPLGNNNRSTAVVTQNKIPVDLGVAITADTDTYFLGQDTQVGYTIVVTNAGPGAANNATLTNALSPNLSITGWQCQVLSGNASCHTPDNYLLDLVDIPFSLDSGASLRFSVQAIAGSAAAGTLNYTAKVMESAANDDVDPSNNTSTVGITGIQPDPIVTAKADVSAHKTANLTQYKPGEASAVQYILVVHNTGPDAAAGNTLQDTLPAGVSQTAVVCTASGTAVCPALSANASLNGIVFDLPVGGSLTWTQSATISSTATGPLVSNSTVNVAAEVGDTNPSNNRTSVRIEPTGDFQAIPVLPRHMLILLALMLAGMAAWQVRTHRR